MSSRNNNRASRKEGNHIDGSSTDRQGNSVQTAWPTLSEQALAITPFWAELINDERSELLSLSLTELRQGASKSNITLPRHQTLTGSLEEGLARLGDGHLWERWQWDNQGSLFTSATAFRSHLQQQRIPTHLKRILTQNTKNLPLTKEQLALQNRMISLQEKIAKYRETQQQQQLQNLTSQPFQNKQVVNMIMQAVMKEHPYMYHAFAAPLIHAVRQLLPSPRSTISYSGLIEDFALFFHDVDMLGSEDLDTITSCLERQIADAARIASIHANDEEQPVAAFEITEQGSKLAVTSQWLQHLQKKSSRPNAQEDVEQSESASPILEWLFSTNTADHPRPSFPGQSVEHSFALLVRTIKPPGKGKTHAAIFSSVLLRAPVTVVLAPGATLPGWRSAIMDVDKQAKVYTTDNKESLRHALSTLVLHSRAQSVAKFTKTHPAVYLVISFNKLTSIQHSQDIFADVRELHRTGKLQLGVVDELHLLTGSGVWAGHMSNLISDCSQASWLGMTGSPIGKQRGQPDGFKCVEMITQAPASTCDADWKTAQLGINQHDRSPITEEIPNLRLFWQAMIVYNSLSQHSMRIHFTAAIPEPERYVVPCSDDPKLFQDGRSKGRLQYEDEVKRRKCKYLAKLIREIWAEPNNACKPVAVFSQYVNSPDKVKNKQTQKPLLAWLQTTLAQSLGIKQTQVGVLTSIEVNGHARGKQGMLWKANPVNFEAEGWRQSGVRMVIVSPEHQMGINGLEFIKHVVLYSCPTTFLVQLHGRFFRLSPSVVMGSAIEPVQMWYLSCEEQGAACQVSSSSRSWEESDLRRGQEREKIAAAAGEGIVDFKFSKEDAAPLEKVLALWSNQRHGQPAHAGPLAMLDPKAASKCQSEPKAGRVSATSDSDDDSLDILWPDGSQGKQRSTVKPKDAELVSELALTAHSVLVGQPEKVLKTLLDTMQHGGIAKSAMQSAPYLLAILQNQEATGPKSAAQAAALHAHAVRAETYLQAAGNCLGQLRRALRVVEIWQAKSICHQSMEICWSQHFSARLESISASISSTTEAGVDVETACDDFFRSRHVSLAASEALSQLVTVIIQAPDCVQTHVPTHAQQRLGVVQAFASCQQIFLVEMSAALTKLLTAIERDARSIIEQPGLVATQLRHSLAALDIEKATSARGVETWPGYAQHASDGMKCVFTIMEIGYATAEDTNAYVIREALAKRDEACSGLHAGVASRQYYAAKKSSDINKRAYQNVDRDAAAAASMLQASTVERARRRCMRALDCKLICLHNSLGFDERPLFRAQLLSAAGLVTDPKASSSAVPLHADPQQAVHMAAQRILKKNQLPAFLPSYTFLCCLHKAVMAVLQQDPNHEGMLHKMKEAGVDCIPMTLQTVNEVVLGLTSKQAHQGDVDSRQTLWIHFKLLGNLFASPVCIAQLQTCRKYLQSNAKLSQTALEGTIAALSAKLELHFMMGHPWRSPDPANLLLLKSQHNAVSMLLRLGMSNTETAADSTAAQRSGVEGSGRSIVSSKRHPEKNISEQEQKRAKRNAR